MLILRLGKMIYMAADKVRSEERNRARLKWGFVLIAIAGVVWLSVPGREEWEDWLFWLELGDVLILAVIIIGAALGATKLAYWMFDYKLSEIRSKFSHAAKAYDLGMLARVPIGVRSQGELSADEKRPEASIAYFLEQEKGKNLYNACRIRGI